MITSPALCAKAKQFLGVVTAMLIFGCIFVYGASSVYAIELFGSAYHFLKKECLGIGVSLLGAFFILITPTERIKNYTPIFFVISTMLVFLTLLPWFAVRIHGSSRWIRIAGVVFQPSELFKVAFILFAAYLLSKRHAPTARLRRDFLPLIGALGIPLCLVLKQPDFGLTVTLSCTTLALLFLAQWNPRHLIGSLIAFFVSGTYLILFYPYRMQRVLTFLNPWKDPHGTGFQIIQSLIAIGSGGWFGAGIGQSKQKFFYLPMQHTDFIFSIVAEEVGFIGTTTLIIAFMFFTYLGLSLACNATNKFTFFCIAGFTIVISLQAIINMAVATGLAPTKGIGLPFISYGNSALSCHIYMVALMVRMLLDSAHDQA